VSEAAPVAADGPLLAVDDVHKDFAGLHAVVGASLALHPGTITALIGPNGAGKTTLFNVITGFLRPDRGQIAFEGRSITGRPPHRVAERGMVRTFQIPKTLAAMPVIDNMLIGARGHPGERLGGLVARPRRSRRREQEACDRALELLETFGLRDKADDYAGTLSGGQRKLLELARALMTEPRLVLLDEPMAGVNPTLGRRLLEHMQTLRREQGMTFLFVEHDMEVVMGHADRVLVMAQGAVIAEAAPEEVRSDPRVIEAYLGGNA